MGFESDGNDLSIVVFYKCIPRKGYKVFIDNKEIGVVTSGTFSSALNTGIAIAFVNIEYLNYKNIYVEIRGKKNKGEVINPPFIKNTSLHN